MSLSSTPLRLAAFLAGLAVVFAAALGVGRLVGPLDVAAAEHAEEADHSAASAGDAGESGAHPAVTGEGEQSGGDAALPAGLVPSVDGHTLTLQRDRLPAGRQDLAFTITGPDGAPLTSYDVVHEKRLHLIVVRRDLTGYQHLHPELGPDGTWRTPVRLAPGSWRVVADFTPAGGAGVVLGTDLAVPGNFEPAARPAPRRTVEVDGYTVHLAGDLAAGWESTLRFRVSRNGAPVTDLQPHLGAQGHLVALGEHDLGYLHVHPLTGDGTAPGEIAFAVQAPGAGAHRLFLEFRHDGRVHTAELAVDTGDATGGDTHEEGSHDH